MAEYAMASSIGARIGMARRARGFRTPFDLAAAMTGSGVTGAILANIESGRRVNLDVSQVLNIAKALGVPVSSLLAPMTRPQDPLDLPGLGSAFDGMTVAEFDSWICTVPNTSYVAPTADERNDRTELNALRELHVLRREIVRLGVVAELEKTAELPESIAERTTARLAGLELDASKLREYLLSAGWEV
jgi:transcriptional regulator with XRE-family HTH domain